MLTLVCMSSFVAALFLAPMTAHALSRPMAGPSDMVQPVSVSSSVDTPRTEVRMDARKLPPESGTEEAGLKKESHAVLTPQEMEKILECLESSRQVTSEQDFGCCNAAEGLELPEQSFVPLPASSLTRESVDDLNRGLLLSYDFTASPQGDQIEDLSGNDRTAVLHNTIWKGSNGLFFNGKDAYVEVLGGDQIHSDRHLTVIGEILPTGYANRAWQSLVWKGNAPDCAQGCSNREFSLWLNVGAFIHATSTPLEKVGRGQVVLNSHVGSATGKTVFAQVIDADNQSMKVYLHGMEAASRAYPFSRMRRSEGPLLIGGGNTLEEGTHFQGFMRWLRIYNRALSDEEIALLSKRVRPEIESPWRDPYLPKDSWVRGGWANTMLLHEEPRFEGDVLDHSGQNLTIRDGWNVYPNAWQQTEIIFGHDGSPLRLSGIATVIDCVDRCSSGRSKVKQVIMGDGMVLWDSGMIGYGDPGKVFDVDLDGVKEIRLVTDNIGERVGKGWAAWINLELDWTGMKILDPQSDLAKSEQVSIPSENPTLPPEGPLKDDAGTLPARPAPSAKPGMSNRF